MDVDDAARLDTSRVSTSRGGRGRGAAIGGGGLGIVGLITPSDRPRLTRHAARIGRSVAVLTGRLRP